jgi:hypothetical protein
MKKTTNTLLWVIDMMSTVIFCALCLQTGFLLINLVYLLVDPQGGKDLLFEMDSLTQLYTLNKFHFSILIFLALTISVMKALAFYFTMKIFSTLNLVKPFSTEIASLISKISYLILTLGSLGTVALRYSESLEFIGVNLNELQPFWDDNAAYLLMGSIVFVIAQVFKKGLELQSESDLTI